MHRQKIMKNNTEIDLEHCNDVCTLHMVHAFKFILRKCMILLFKFMVHCRHCHLLEINNSKSYWWMAFLLCLQLWDIKSALSNKSLKTHKLSSSFCFRKIAVDKSTSHENILLKQGRNYSAACVFMCHGFSVTICDHTSIWCHGDVTHQH